MTRFTTGNRPSSIEPRTHRVTMTASRREHIYGRIHSDNDNNRLSPITAFCVAVAVFAGSWFVAAMIMGAA